MKSLIILLFSMSILTSCQRNENNSVAENTSVAKTLLNVSYGKDSLQKMDVYLPAHRSVDSTNAIILIHGGGWTGGSKADFGSYIDTFRRRLPDYALFNINYRLVNGSNLFPTQEQDVKAAVDFITSHKATYHFNANKIALMGASAGAHLALLQAYKYNSPQVKAVIDYFGPTDLVTMYKHPWHPLVPMALQMITGTTPVANEKLYIESSPVYYVNSSSAPTLILHGGNDNVVDVSQSRLLSSRLQNAGVDHELAIYPRERHGWWYGASMTNSLDKIQKFLEKHLD
jgi:acetyl esterase/lipase